MFLREIKEPTIVVNGIFFCAGGSQFGSLRSKPAAKMDGAGDFSGFPAPPSLWGRPLLHPLFEDLQVGVGNLVARMGEEGP